MVLLLWFYISGLVMLLGAELNAEIEHASPYGKAAGEKVPGERRAIGALAFGRYQKLPAPASQLSCPHTSRPPAGPLGGHAAPRGDGGGGGGHRLPRSRALRTRHQILQAGREDRRGEGGEGDRA